LSQVYHHHPHHHHHYFQFNLTCANHGQSQDASHILEKEASINLIARIKDNGWQKANEKDGRVEA
jgi:hypothetical protein